MRVTIESFWTLLRRGYYGTYHRMLPKHLHRFVDEFAGRLNERFRDTVDMMAVLAGHMVGKRLRTSSSWPHEVWILLIHNRSGSLACPHNLQNGHGSSENTALGQDG